jgi:hypothetical protein
MQGRKQFAPALFIEAAGLPVCRFDTPTAGGDGCRAFKYFLWTGYEWSLRAKRIELGIINWAQDW